MYKIAVLTSHPIQYQTPLFRKLAERSDVDLTVYFCWDAGVKKTYDYEFQQKIEWDIPLLIGYKFQFLKNLSPKPSSEFLGQVNFGIIPEIMRSKYDCIVVFGWNSFTNWLAFFTAILTGTPIFLRGETPLSQELLKSKLKLFLKKLILKPLFKRISVFLYIGQENREFYKFYSVPKEKLFFAPYGVDNERFIKEVMKLRSKRKELRKRLINAPNNLPVILFVGKLIQKKRPMDLLRAYQLLITHHKLSAQLVFVGDGELKGQLETYVRENKLSNVHFAGFQNQTKLPEYYSIADIFVLPSGSGETWGLVVNEAMCAKLPIIVSDIVGCAVDLVKEGENGFVFPVGNIFLLGELLKNLVESSERRRMFGKKSLEIVRYYCYENSIIGIINGLTAVNALK